MAVLDGLRGFAVAIVLASHLSNHRMFGNEGMALAGTGKSGVYLFFVLSAFLLTRLLLAKGRPALHRADTWLDYALRRVLRIWPLYLIVLFGSWWLSSRVPAWHYHIDTPALGRHLLLQDGQSVLWSIPVEFKAYLVLPLIVLGLAALQRLHGMWSALLLGLGFLACMWIWPTSAMAANSVALGPYLTTFVAGAAAAWLELHLREGGVRLHPRACSAWVGAMLILWLATTPVAMSALLGRPVAADANHGAIPAFALIWGSLLVALLHSGAGVQALFRNRPMRWLGWISFSLYLWHMVVIDLWKAAGLPAGPMPVMGLIACILLASTISYGLVERPFRHVRWRRGQARPVSPAVT